MSCTFKSIRFSACVVRAFQCLVLMVLVSPSSVSGQGDSKRPNILIIVADDLGWADVGYHKAPFPTPTIDGLCQAGVELDQHYVSPQCTPTRVALLTGRYPSRFGNAAPSNDRVLPWGTVTLADMLGERGYRTAISGKWHLGSKPEYGPCQFGFDRSYGSLAGGVGPYNHLYKGGLKVWHRDDKLIEEEGHVTDLIAEEAVKVIGEPGEKPFFLYLAFTAVHDPFDEPEKYLELVKHLPKGRQQYAASAVHMDEAIGTVVTALKENGQYDNTLIIFSSDNGPVPESGGNSGGLRGNKRNDFEGGIRVPFIVKWLAVCRT